MKKKNKKNQNNRFSDKSSSEDFYNIISLTKKDYPIVFSMIKEKLKKQIKDKKLLKEMKISEKNDL